MRKYFLFILTTWSFIMYFLIFWRYKTNRFAFRFLYLGWNYQGFASQENTENTIEVSKSCAQAAEKHKSDYYNFTCPENPQK